MYRKKLIQLKELYWGDRLDDIFLPNMTIHLNLKKLTKDMVFTDKMKILLEDINVHAESSGERNLLGPSEKQALFDTMQKNNQIGEYNRIYAIYKIVNLLIIDTIIHSQALKMSILELSKFLTGGLIKGVLTDTIDEIIFDLATQNYSIEDREKKDIQDKIDKKRDELLLKYRIGSSELMRQIDYFVPSIVHKSYFSTELNSDKIEINPQIQELFMDAIEGAKRLNETIYEVEYALTLVGFNCLSDSQQKDLESKRKLLENFMNLEGLLRLMRIYQNNPFKKVKITCNAKPLFLESINNIKAKIELTDNDKQQAKKTVDKAIDIGL